MAKYWFCVVAHDEQTEQTAGIASHGGIMCISQYNIRIIFVYIYETQIFRLFDQLIEFNRHVCLFVTPYVCANSAEMLYRCPLIHTIIMLCSYNKPIIIIIIITIVIIVYFYVWKATPEQSKNIRFDYILIQFLLLLEFLFVSHFCWAKTIDGIIVGYQNDMSNGLDDKIRLNLYLFCYFWTIVSIKIWSWNRVIYESNVFIRACTIFSSYFIFESVHWFFRLFKFAKYTIVNQYKCADFDLLFCPFHCVCRPVLIRRVSFQSF